MNHENKLFKFDVIYPLLRLREMLGEDFLSRQRFKEEDLTLFTSFSNLTLSPSGEFVAFNVVKPDLSSNSYTSYVQVMNVRDKTVKAVTKGPLDLAPAWISDSELIYISKTSLSSATELKLLNLNGGEPRTISRFEKQIQEVKHLRGRFISYLMPETSDEVPEAIVTDRIPIWFNGVGFIYNAKRTLHVMNIDSGHDERLTPDTMNVITYSPSKHGNKIAIASEYSELKPMLADIYLLDVDKNELNKVNETPLLVESLTWSDDEKYLVIAGHAMERGYATHSQVLILDTASKSIKSLTKNLDRGVSRRVYYDLRGPFSAPLTPIVSGNFIYFTLSDGGAQNLYRININSGSVEKVVTGDFVIEEFDVRGDLIAYIKTTDVLPAEVYLMVKDREERLTDFNMHIIRKYEVIKPERFIFKASDGVEVEGWVIKPANFKAGVKYPAIVNIHGGPKSKFGYAFMFEHQLYASKGYVVIYLNPRGSDGYTQEFADIRCHYGERDYLDIIEGVKYLVSAKDYIDPQRLGVTGISYGGFMTNWIITQTDMFKAAISQNGISDWIAEFGTTDIGYHFVPDQICGDPINGREVLISKSPLFHVARIKTPLLILHSLNDYRCYVDQALQLYTLLKYLNKETQLALFKEGEHAFGWTGKPLSRIRRLKVMLNFFNKKLR